jgi:L-fucose isomerase-like protein
MSQAVLAVIVGNRDFFPDRLVSEGRQEIRALLGQMNVEPVILGESDTKLGGVETWPDAKKCADLFRTHSDKIDGILVVLPNFGDERGVAETVKLSGLNVPILVQAYPDDLESFTVERRRDAWCGKISVCNNLRQYGYPFSLTADHTVRPDTQEFRTDLERFLGVCRVVKGLRTARLGAIGARPGAFNTVRYSEKLLQACGISVSTIDLSELFAAANKLGDGDPQVRQRIESIQGYIPTEGMAPEALARMARLALVIEEWMAVNDLDASALQCWTSMQQNYGINACTLMSMMSEKLMPSACEVDVTGTASMYALQLASGTPSALVDWNNNYGDDPDKCVLFHCGNWARSFFPRGEFQMTMADIIGTTLRPENTCGAIAGRVPPGPFTFARISTDDLNGAIRAYVGEGILTDDSLQTFGSRAVAEIPDLQTLMRYVCKNGFEHHVAINKSHTAAILAEAFETYFGFDVYRHETYW